MVIENDSAKLPNGCPPDEVFIKNMIDHDGLLRLAVDPLGIQGILSRDLTSEEASAMQHCRLGVPVWFDVTVWVAWITRPQIIRDDGELFIDDPIVICKSELTAKEYNRLLAFGRTRLW